LILAGSVSLLTIQSILNASMAFVVKSVFDDILSKKSVSSLVTPCVAILLIVTCAGLCSRVARQQVLRATKIVIAGLRRELLAKSYALGNFFAAPPDRAKLHSLIVLDTERIDVMSSAIGSVALPAFLTVTLLCAALLWLAPRLLLVVLLVGSISIVVNHYVGGNMRRWVERFNLAFERFSQGVLAALQRMELTRSMGMERTDGQRRAEEIEALRTTSGSMALSATTYNVAQTYVTALITLSILLAGGEDVISGRMSLSTLAAAYVIVSQLGSALGNLWNAVPQIIAGHKSLLDVDQTLCREDVVPRGGVLEKAFEGVVEFRNVCFAYGAQPVLVNINLRIAKGEHAVIMGANGAGKSTLALLLLGVYACQQGEVLLDNTPLETLSLENFRSQIGVVLQEQYLFPGTVAENILFGRSNINFSDLVSAAVLTGADSFIRALPDGYNTMIGSGGTVLSGGQSQLVALTRAIAGKPKLLILDEPTNHLDRETALELCRVLQQLPFSPTMLLITHDAETASAFSRLVWLQDGRVSKTACLAPPTGRVDSAQPVA
jgi:ABC-type bacteriocin/lantibiotic exporter with double-glycine peptidase domain